MVLADSPEYVKRREGLMDDSDPDLDYAAVKLYFLKSNFTTNLQILWFHSSVTNFPNKEIRIVKTNKNKERLQILLIFK